MTHLVGSDKNQIPTNQELGNLAFQNGDVKALGVGDLTATDIQVNANTTSVKPTLNLDFANFSKASDYIDPRILFISTGKTWNGRQNYTSLVRTTNSIPRYEFVGEEATGLLLESAATNQCAYSYGTTGWTVNGTGSVTANQTAPDGSSTAVLYTDTATTSQYSYFRASAVTPIANETWCVSCYIKKQTTDVFPLIRFYASSTQDFRINVNAKTGQYITGNGTVGVVVGSGVIDCGGWWRIWVSGYYSSGTPTYGRLYFYPAWNTTAVTSGAGSNSATGSCTAWGFQIEKSAYPSSLILTNGAAVTRTIDQYLIQNISSFYNQVEGTIVTEFTSKTSVSATVVGFEGTGSADANSIRIRVGSAGGLLGQIRSSGADVNLITNAYTPNTTYKVAYAYKAGDCGMCVNGGIVQTQSAASIPTVSYMTIGNEYSGATPINALDGNIKKITYYPKRLSNAELIELTK